MLAKNHKKINRFALLPISSYVFKFHKDEFINILPKEPIGKMGVIILALFLYDIAITLPDIDTKSYVPFKHRTWTHSIWGLIGICYMAYTYIDVNPRYMLYALSFSISYYLHLLMDDFSPMGCDMFYPLFGYKKYGGKRAKYRRGPLKFTFYDVGSKFGEYKIIKGRRIRKKSENVFTYIVIFIRIFITIGVFLI